jgi:hypothetical protein
LELLKRHIKNDMPRFLPLCFMMDDALKIMNALKHAWPDDEIKIYL